MTREEKEQLIGDLTEKLEQTSNFYLTDISGLTVIESNNLRRLCFNKGVELRVVKNTLLKKAMERAEGNYDESYKVLKGNTALFFSESGSLPAKLIVDFRKKSDRPILKAAFVEQTFYFGDEELKTLATIKSKNELIGDVIGLLQSPIANVISGLKSGGSTLSGILKALEERPEQPSDVEEPAAETKSNESSTEDANAEGETADASDDKSSDLSPDVSDDVSSEAEAKDEASAESEAEAKGEEDAKDEGSAEAEELVKKDEAESEDGADNTETETKTEEDAEKADNPIAIGSEEENTPEEDNKDASTDNSDEEGETSEEESEPKNEN